jgi:hypothetical protein
MTYVVYHTKSTRTIKTFEKESAAKRSTTCMNRKATKGAAGDCTDDHTAYIPYAYTDQENYDKNVVYTKKVINMMSGLEIEIPSNTPHSCDPSTETYWSM